MTKAELIAAVADKTGLSRTQAKDAVEAFLESMVACIKAGEDCRLVGFGTFTSVKRPAGTARNPRTGASVQRPASVSCRFKPGDALKAALNG